MTDKALLEQFPIGSYARIVGTETWRYSDNNRQKRKLLTKDKPRVGQVVRIIHTLNMVSDHWVRLVVQLKPFSKRKRKNYIEIEVQDLKPITSGLVLLAEAGR